jgi:hypothetical protein
MPLCRDCRAVVASPPADVEADGAETWRGRKRASTCQPRACEGTGRSGRGVAGRNWPRKPNPVRLGSYVSRASGASGVCELSAGVLAAGPVEAS